MRQSFDKINYSLSHVAMNFVSIYEVLTHSQFIINEDSLFSFRPFFLGNIIISFFYKTFSVLSNY